MDEQMRDKFEQWHSDGGTYPKAVERSATGDYVYMGASTAWTAWQACAAALSQPAAQGDSSHPAGGECGGVQGAETVPSYRGYALLGIGAYIIFHSDPPDEPELVIRIADASDVEGGREIGETRRAPKRLVYPEEMAIRIGFTSVAGLDALEVQLRSLRAEHFAGKGGAA